MNSYLVTRLLLLFLLMTMMAPSHKTARGEGPIREPQFDSKAQRVELFNGIEEGQLDYKLIMKGMNEGNLIIENKTNQTLTVEMPVAIAGVHVIPQALNQVNNGNGFFGNNANNSSSNGQSNSNGSANGSSQSVGGGIISNGSGFANNNSNDTTGANSSSNGFFSIPAGKKFLFPLNTVCLEYGKPNPNVKATYKLVKVETFTQDQYVIELLKLVGTEKVDQGSAQAASWFLSSKKTWKELTDMRMGQLPNTRDIPVFTKDELKSAKMLVAKAEARAREVTSRQKSEPNEVQEITQPDLLNNPRLKMTVKK